MLPPRTPPSAGANSAPIGTRPDCTPHDSPREACGVFGIYHPNADVARSTFFGLYALQHRGQESAGIATSDGDLIRVYAEMGLVAQVFREEDLERLTGHIAIGHTRYSTMGAPRRSNAQPFVVSGPSIKLAMSHNGNVINARDLREELSALGSANPEPARRHSGGRDGTCERAAWVRAAGTGRPHCRGCLIYFPAAGVASCV